ncbi:MAG: hypothetical protein QOF14_438 [Hyphomicrobiales bacterium]|nr:hypothetical protein [Hyphomicrobiales bacterium]
MTIGDDAEIRRTSVSTKVLMVGLAVLAVLGSFWSIVWFIRSYVEAPRISMAPMALAARESTPVAPTPVRSATIAPAKAQPAADPPATSAPVTAEAAPRAADAISDRWMPPPPAPEPAPVAPPETSAPAALATPADTDPPVEDVAESSVPAISGSAPLPRRKPTQTAAVRPRNSDPPLPRPRPDGPAPQSVWTAVPTTDDRFPPQ